MNEEIWVDIIGFEGRYKISKSGKIMNSIVGNIIKPWLNTRGYESVTLRKDGKQKSLKVHKLMAINFLNHEPSGMNRVVDHIDGNKLNNNLENLRIVSQRKNTHNTYMKKYSKYVGVSFDKRSQKWVSNIRINGKGKFLGSFKCELAAAHAYNKKIIEYGLD
jgi:ribosomal protein L22